MGTGIARVQSYSGKSVLAEQTIHGLKKLFRDWFAFHARQKKDWNRFMNTSSGFYVPYRVWLRRSAFLHSMKRDVSGH